MAHGESVHAAVVERRRCDRRDQVLGQDASIHAPDRDVLAFEPPLFATLRTMANASA